MRPYGRRTRPDDERGVTLAEVLIALALIGVGLVGLIAVVPASTAGVQEGGQLSTATFLAEQLVERARAAAWTTEPTADCLGASTGDAPPVPQDGSCQGRTTTQFPDETAGVSGYPGYRRTLRVTGCDTGPGCAGIVGDGLRRVVVTVQYTPMAVGGGSAPGPRAVQLEWLASRR